MKKIFVLSTLPFLLLGCAERNIHKLNVDPTGAYGYDASYICDTFTIDFYFDAQNIATNTYWMRITITNTSDVDQEYSFTNVVFKDLDTKHSWTTPMRNPDTGEIYEGITIAAGNLQSCYTDKIAFGTEPMDNIEFSAKVNSVKYILSGLTINIAH